MNYLDFLRKYIVPACDIDPLSEADKMCKALEDGLKRFGATVPMIPAYVSNSGIIDDRAKAIVIDAGGTNFRRALVQFNNDKCEVSELMKCKMPGIDAPVTWEDFIAFTADKIEPIINEADSIGFCFSYAADITPNVDGRVVRIDKEVVVTGCEGKLIGQSLSEELNRRGYPGKRVVIINDTVAVLMGGSSVLDKSRYSGFVGQVSGTGTNTCCTLPIERVEKLGIHSGNEIIVNLESGLYDGIKPGPVERQLDSESNNPGLKTFEKMTSGVYLGELARRILTEAGNEGLITAESKQKLKDFGKFDTSVVDSWACSERISEVFVCDEDREVAANVCAEILKRSATCMSINLLAILKLTGIGKEKPAAIIAEGSLVQKSRIYRPALEELLKVYAEGEMGRKVEYIIGNDTTISGSAAAAILNT